MAAILKPDAAPDSPVALLTLEQRIWFTAKALIGRWSGSITTTNGTVNPGLLLYEMAMLTEAQFVKAMMATAHEGASLAEGFTEREWGAVHGLVVHYTKDAEKAGAAWRKRKGEKMSLADFKDIIRRQASKARRFWEN